MRLLRAGMPVRMPLYPSRDKDSRQVHAVLSPHHEGTDDSVLRELPNGGATTGGSQESKRSDSRVPEDSPGAGAEAADGDRGEGLLQRAGWVSAVTSSQSSALSRQFASCRVRWTVGVRTEV